MYSSSKNPSCPFDYVIHLVGNKWSFAIVRDLCQGTKRTSELLNSLKGISPRTLSERLRSLEQHGLIDRKVYPEIPPRVEYSLTQRGCELRPVIIEIKELGQRWQKAVKSANKADSKLDCTHCLKDPDSADCADRPATGKPRKR